MVDYQEDFLQKIVSVNWPARGLITIETSLHLIVNTTPGDTSFVTGWGPGLRSPLVSGNLNTTLGPEFLPPSVTPKMRKNLGWGWKKYTKNNDFTGGSGGYTTIDRGLYNVQTDKGTMTSSADGMPFIIDWNGENLGGGPPIALDGKTLYPYPSGNGGITYLTTVDTVMLGLFGRNAVPGASVYFPHLLSVISSHTVPGPSVVTYDRTYGTLNFLNLGKLKGNQASFTITTPFVAGVNRAAWNIRVATWKKEKVFVVDGFNSLTDLSKAVATNVKFTLGGGELDVPAKTITYVIDLKTLKMTVTGP